VVPERAVNIPICSHHNCKINEIGRRCPLARFAQATLIPSISGKRSILHVISEDYGGLSCSYGVIERHGASPTGAHWVCCPA
jgi:hypothetical protein